MVITDFYKKLSYNENGAASVLVVFMMIVLVTLGAFAITSANVNYKFSMRSFDWNAMFYSLDSKGEEYICALDSKLAEAEKMAVDYVASGRYASAEHSDLPELMQAEIYDGYKAADLNDDYVGDILNKVYLYYADIYLSELTLTYTDSEVYPIENGMFIEGMLAMTNIKSERTEDEHCGLSISVWVEPVEYEVTESADSFSVIRVNNNPRYVIEDWYEYQEPVDQEEPTMELWDGTL